MADARLPAFCIILLRLPDGRVALQRRTLDAPFSPGKLGFFGGGIESAETPLQCIERELVEEISIPIPSDSIKLIRSFILPQQPNDTFKGGRQFYLYEAPIASADFEIHEGSGVECFTPEALQSRTDLTQSATYVSRNLL